VAGERRSIVLPDRSARGPWTLAASIPAGSTEVDLVLTAAGFSQRFSLMTLTRPGPDPVALYRDDTNPAVVSTDTSAVAVGATVAADGQSYQVSSAPPPQLCRGSRRTRRPIPRRRRIWRNSRSRPTPSRRS
jgi:hypothetical protein